MYCYYMKRILSSPHIYLCSLLIFVLLFWPVHFDVFTLHMYEVYDRLNICELFIFAAMDLAPVLLPIISTIPFLSIYVSEMDKKYIYYQIIRSGKTNFYCGQICAALTSSILMIISAISLFTIVCVGFGATWMESSYILSVCGKFFEPMVREGNIVGVYFVRTGAMCLNALPWTFVGMTVSLFVRNKYIIFASPYILNMILAVQTAFTGCFTIDPGNTYLKGDIRDTALGGLVYAFAYHGILIAVMVTVYCVGSARRFKSGKF